MSSTEVNNRFHASWRHPFQNAQVCLEAIPFRGLTTRAVRFAEKPEPSEVGGLLWGKVVSGPDGKTILIRQAEFISADGCLFNSTDAGMEHLCIALGRNRTDLEPLGYFRSAIRADLFPREQDRAFLETKLARPDSFALIVEPLITGACTAHFYFLQNGRLQMQSSLLRVPLVPQNSDGEQEAHETPQLPAVSEPPFTARTRAVVPPLETRPRVPYNEMAVPEHHEVAEHSQAYGSHSSWSMGRTLLAVGLLLAMVGVSLYRIMSSRPDAAALKAKGTETPIGLQVERRPDGQLDLNWNKNFARLAAPEGARLSITDGSYIRTLSLTRDQLLSGKIAYFPRSDDIRFHLDISIGNNRTVGESIRVVSPEVYASSFPETDSRLRRARTEALAEPVSHNYARDAKVDSPVTRTLDMGASIVKTDTPGTYILPSRQARRVPSGHESKQAVSAPPQQDQAVTITPVPQAIITAIPPPINTNQPKGGANAKLIAAITTPQNLPIAPPPAATPLEPQAKNPEPPASETFRPKNPAPLTEPPTPIYQMMPNTRPFGYSLVNNDLQINVEVHIDENGIVRKVNLVEGKSGRSTMLSGQALLAAKKWRFNPATVDGRRVPSTYVIGFKFRKAP